MKRFVEFSRLAMRSGRIGRTFWSRPADEVKPSGLPGQIHHRDHDEENEIERPGTVSGSEDMCWIELALEILQ